MRDRDLAVSSNKVGVTQNIASRISPLLVIGLCGLVGILVDIDHPIGLWLGIKDTRFLHPYLFLGSIIVLCGLGSYLGGLLLRLVLSNDKG